MKRHYIILSIFCVILVIAPTHLTAKQKTKGKGGTLSKHMFNSKGPIHIVSNRLDADNKKRIISFSGHVVVKRSTLTMTCDRLTVKYSPKGGEISQITA